MSIRLRLLSAMSSISAVSPRHPCIGWDIGGAHLKVARLDADGRLVEAAQYATPLWLGLGPLRDILTGIGRNIDGRSVRHGLTMTGELVDVFPDRDHGVNGLLDAFESGFPGHAAAVYSNDGSFLSVPEARRDWRRVASANWHATASLAARLEPRGILIDIGSTTTDLVPFDAHSLCHRGNTDQERLRFDELVYTGIVRTPVMALVQRVPFAGRWQNLAADFFATTADVYRITGELREADDLLDPADHGGKRREDSLRRLARMLGTDAGPGLEPELSALAGFIAERQIDLIDGALQRLLGDLPGVRGAPLIGAGSGRFLVRRLASRCGVRYVDFDELAGIAGSDGAAVCATAVAVALLARTGHA
jgi:probable H4MPT-linked C1 transfer pathway protein